MFDQGEEFGAGEEVVEAGVEPVLSGEDEHVFFGDFFAAGRADAALFDLPDGADFAEDVEAGGNDGILDVPQTDETILKLPVLDFIDGLFEVAF
jgi:hypothetical protein